MRDEGYKKKRGYFQIQSSIKTKEHILIVYLTTEYTNIQNIHYTKKAISTSHTYYLVPLNTDTHVPIYCCQSIFLLFFF